jgi:hypothetical protein
MNMRLLGLAIGAFAVAGTAVGAEQPVPIGPFAAIEASSGIDVTFSPGPPSAVLVGDAAKFDRVDVRVEGDRLIVRRKGGILVGAWRGEVKVRVTGPAQLTALTASSGANLEATGIAASDLRLTSSSGADLRVSGVCENLRADASSGSDLNAKDLICADVSAEASSGADAIVHAEKSLRAGASSGGDVAHYGPASAVDVRESSGGDVTRRN